jgi:hypothetical protein
MQRGHWLLLALILSLMAQTGCRREAEPAPEKAAEPAPAPAPAPAVAPAQIEEMSETIAALQKRIKELEGDQARVKELEQELAYLKSGLNALEKRPIPAPPKPVEAPAEPAVDEPAEKPPEEKLAMPEPVPTGVADEADVQEEAEEPAEPETADAPAEPDVKAQGADVTVAVGDVKLVNMKFATRIDRKTRQPVEEKLTFSRTENRLYCWMVLSNLAEEETQVRLFWRHEGKPISDITLNVGRHTSHWRTWAYITPQSVGQWEVELQDMAGQILGTGGFTVE